MEQVQDWARETAANIEQVLSESRLFAESEFPPTRIVWGDEHDGMTSLNQTLGDDDPRRVQAGLFESHGRAVCISFSRRLDDEPTTRIKLRMRVNDARCPVPTAQSYEGGFPKLTTGPAPHLSISRDQAFELQRQTCTGNVIIDFTEADGLSLDVSAVGAFVDAEGLTDAILFHALSDLRESLDSILWRQG